MGSPLALGGPRSSGSIWKAGTPPNKESIPVPVPSVRGLSGGDSLGREVSCVTLLLLTRQNANGIISSPQCPDERGTSVFPIVQMSKLRLGKTSHSQ